jgi:hypothetical protein
MRDQSSLVLSKMLCSCAVPPSPSNRRDSQVDFKEHGSHANHRSPLVTNIALKGKVFSRYPFHIFRPANHFLSSYYKSCSSSLLAISLVPFFQTNQNQPWATSTSHLASGIFSHNKSASVIIHQPTWKYKIALYSFCIEIFVIVDTFYNIDHSTY